MRNLNRTESRVLLDAVEILQSLAFEGDERRADYSAEDAVSPSAAFGADLLAGQLESFTDLHAAPAYPDFLAHLKCAPNSATRKLMRDAGHTAMAWQGLGFVWMSALLWDGAPFIVPNWEVALDLAKAMARQ